MNLNILERFIADEKIYDLVNFNGSIIAIKKGNEDKENENKENENKRFEINICEKEDEAKLVPRSEISECLVDYGCNIYKYKYNNILMITQRGISTIKNVYLFEEKQKRYFEIFPLFHEGEIYDYKVEKIKGYEYIVDSLNKYKLRYLLKDRIVVVPKMIGEDITSIILSNIFDQKDFKTNELCKNIWGIDVFVQKADLIYNGSYKIYETDFVCDTKRFKIDDIVPKFNSNDIKIIESKIEEKNDKIRRKQLGRLILFIQRFKKLINLNFDISKKDLEVIEDFISKYKYKCDCVPSISPAVSTSTKMEEINGNIQEKECKEINLSLVGDDPYDTRIIKVISIIENFENVLNCIQLYDFDDIIKLENVIVNMTKNYPRM